MRTRVVNGRNIGGVRRDTQGLLLSTPAGLARLKGDRLTLLRPSTPARTFSLTTDGSGAIWLCGGDEAGLYRWRGGRGCRRESMDLQQSCTAVYTDSRGRVWAGFDGGSLLVHDHDQWQTRWQGTGPASRICALYEDDAGTFWVATNAGLGRLRGDQFALID